MSEDSREQTGRMFVDAKKGVLFGAGLGLVYGLISERAKKE